MKNKIKVYLRNPLREMAINGDWIDLKANENITLHKGIDTLLDLGVAMQLPKGYEAIVLPRSSLYKHKHCIVVNSMGVIDNGYCGSNDIWYAHLISTEDDNIEVGERIVQFRIQLSQFASVWQKIRWLFSNGVKIEYVDHLDNPNRGGIGSTGGYTITTPIYRQMNQH